MPDSCLGNTDVKNVDLLYRRGGVEQQTRQQDALGCHVKIGGRFPCGNARRVAGRVAGQCALELGDSRLGGRHTAAISDPHKTQVHQLMRDAGDADLYVRHQCARMRRIDGGLIVAKHQRDVTGFDTARRNNDSVRGAFFISLPSLFDPCDGWVRPIFVDRHRNSKVSRIGRARER